MGCSCVAHGPSTDIPRGAHWAPHEISRISGQIVSILVVNLVRFYTYIIGSHVVFGACFTCDHISCLCSREVRVLSYRYCLVKACIPMTDPRALLNCFGRDTRLTLVSTGMSTHSIFHMVETSPKCSTTTRSRWVAI